MSESFGNGVSRTLSALNRQFDTVVWQKGKPPLDSELNLMSQIDVEKMQELVRSMMNSGFIIDPTIAIEDFQFHKKWSNYFKLGIADGTNSSVLYANVGGMIVPVCGTAIDSISNKIKLSPPPESDNRVDFVFLEVWKTLVAPNPSTLNKPSADKVHKYGNVEYGGANIIDDIEDPNIGFETSERVQIQYRIRVYGSGVGLGSGVALQDHPDGLGDPNILGQGTASSPVGGFFFENMKNTLSDPSLWRAGDGDTNNALGTLDGYVYAIPICAVFRRNSNPFVATNLSGNPNQNGGFERTPGNRFLANPRDGAKTLTTVSLVNDLTSDYVGIVQVNDLIGSGLDDNHHTIENVQLIIDNEIVSISEMNVSSNPNTITISQRGRYGTSKSGHKANTSVYIFNTRVDGRFSDEITKEDVLDLRRSITMGEWDYSRLLQNNLSSLMKGTLHSSFKRSSVGDTEGPVVTEVSYLYADGTTDTPNYTEAVDGPDGIRTAFSDAATLERDVCLLLDNDVTLVGGITQDQFDTNVGWDISPDFKPSGFLNNEGANGSWTNGSIIFLHIGGEDGSSGARNTFRDGGERAVRFVTPREFWKNGYPVIDPNNGNQYPITLRFLSEKSHQPKVTNEDFLDTYADLKHPGPMHPVRTHNFEYPFIVLGGLLHTSLKISNITCNTKLTSAAGVHEIDLGINFDTPSGFFTKDSRGEFESDPAKVSTPLFHGERTLYDMLTNNGTDLSGDSSEVYVVLYGDTSANAKDNNGCFKVVGAGTVGYTHKSATSSTKIRVKALDPEFNNTFYTASTGSVTVEFRSQHTHSLDGGGLTKGTPSLCIVMTDLQGLQPHKWRKTTLNNTNGSLDYSLPTQIYDGRVIAKVPSKAVISTTLIYEPNRGATARVPDVISTVAVENADSTFLRQSKGNLDADFSSLTGTPEADLDFLPTHIQLWNKLASKGWHAPDAPSYGGRVIANSEQDRETEAFFDRGSKTLVFRPYRSRQMTLQALTTPLTFMLSDATVPVCLLGRYDYPNGIPKDGLTLFTGDQTSGKKMGFALPPECMPRFGRQDIPFTSAGLGSFLFGINHLFIDSTELNNNVFKIIGGEDNISGGASVKSLFFRTNAPASYGESGTVIGAALNKPYYEARKSTDIGSSTTNQKLVRKKFSGVRSSDLGSGLKGIQLPPYLGLARVYGVYDYDDYIAKGGLTYTSNRSGLESGDIATNLLRQDNHVQTLFIMEDGAIDLTNETGDHTYIIPSNVIDTTLSPNHKINDNTSGKENFEDFNYVVECVVFGFAKDWINGNNYVLARRHHSQGAEIVDGSDEQIEDINMVFPCAAPLNSRVQVTYNRTVYQGDPYFTRFGNVKTITDYERRYGQVSTANTHQLAYPIQQFDSNGNSIIETPNKRVFQVLASVDFYTTMGTGKIGGELYAGTLMDTGYLDNKKSRIAVSETENRLQVVPRAFTDSQLKNGSRASLKIQQIGGDKSGIEDWTIKFTRLDGEIVTFCLKATPSLPSTWPPYYFEVQTDDANSVNMMNLHTAINNSDSADGLSLTCYSVYDGSTIELYSVATGEQGNQLKVSMTPEPNCGFDVDDFFLIRAERSNFNLNFYGGLGNKTPTASFFAGGKDLPANGGDGVSQINLGGMTERFPLGILLNDSDFICENPLNDSSSAVQTFTSSIRPLQKLLPLTKQGEEVDRFLGVPSEYVTLTDGGVLNYTSFNQTDRPTGTKKFRIFRGGGSCMLVSGNNPGGPLEFVSGSLSAPLQPVLKGGALVGKALLVKNFSESVFNDPTKVMSSGEEIQMLIVTNGIIGNPHTVKDGITLQGEISPSGYGEGYASADRYRLNGKPMFAPNTQKHPNIEIDPVPYLKGE